MGEMSTTRSTEIDAPVERVLAFLAAPQAAGVWTNAEIEAFGEADLEACEDPPSLAPMGADTCSPNRYRCVSGPTGG